MNDGDRLRAARLAADLSQGKLAEALGISQSYVADVERGRRQPTLEWLILAADAVGCNRSELDERLADRVDTPRAEG